MSRRAVFPYREKGQCNSWPPSGFGTLRLRCVCGFDGRLYQRHDAGETRAYCPGANCTRLHVLSHRLT